MVRKISGQGKGPVRHLNTANGKVTAISDIANKLADALSKTSSSDNYSDEFLATKDKKESHRLNFDSNNSESYKQPFYMRELK